MNLSTAIETYPLTEAQEGLWFMQALDPANPILNTGQYLDLRGAIDRDALRTALQVTLDETQSLRLRFDPGSGAPRQWLDPAPITPRWVDLSDDPEGEVRALAEMWADSARPIDLASQPPAAFAVYVLSADRCLLYERIHHLSIDGYGMVLLTNRIGRHYGALTGHNDAPAPMPPLKAMIEDDRAYRGSSQREAERAWWLQQAADLPPASGPAEGRAETAHDFLRDARWLDPALLARLATRAEGLKLGWPDLLTALTGAYLARWSGGDAVIGLPFMARMGRRIASLPCMAMNVLPQRILLDEDQALDEWLPQIAGAMRQARRHGRYRSEYLRRETGRIGAGRRLYGPLVNVQPFDRPPVFAGLTVGLHIMGAGAVDDLSFTFRGDPRAGMLFELDANPRLYSRADVAAHAARLTDFLGRALGAERLAKVATASDAEARAVDDLHRQAVHDLPATSLTALIEAAMARRPDATAIRFGEQTLGVAELDRRSAALAAHLRGLGAGSDRLVAVALNRSLDLPVALLGILRAGAAYLPLDPDHPPARIARVLDLAQPVAVLTSADLAGTLPEGVTPLMVGDWPDEGADRPLPTPSPDDLAYVIFTSGSTGAPKGVMIEHRAIANRLQWMAEAYGIDASDRILQKTPASFDVSVWEFFLPMMTGAELVMLEPGAHRDPGRLSDAIRRHAITVLHFVPSMLSAFLAAPGSDGLRLRRVFCSGEELSADLRDRFHARIAAELHNLYGPTEAAVDVSHWAAGPQDRSNPVPIGWPVWNSRLEILDQRMRPQPPGLAGDLYLGGTQLARGYLGRPDLTAARFIPDPRDPGQRLYATGDLARRRHDGAVEFLGRSDHQVKLRGLRIELGEIEAAILQTGLAREAIVIAREDHPGDRRLVAYLVAGPDYRADLLQTALARSLPDYMIPSALVTLAEMPLTANGKLDRKALPPPDRRTDGRAATTAIERVLARLFAEILHLPEPPPVEADFFALGGDSLSALRLLLRIEEETGRDPGLGGLFQSPRILALAALLDDAAAHDDGLGPLILLAEGDRRAAPLFLIHPAGGLCWGYRHLARLIAPDRRVWGLQHPGLDPARPLPDSLTALAQDYVARIRFVVPHGRVHLAGWSVGGLIAQEMAAQMRAGGDLPGLVAVLDSYPADAWRSQPDPDPVQALRALLAIAGHDPDAHRDLDSRQKVMDFLRRDGGALGQLPTPVLDGVIRCVTDTNRLVRGHHHSRMTGPLLHLRAALDPKDSDLSPAMWRPYAGRVEVIDTPFLHAQMTSPEASALIAPDLRRRLDD